MAKPMAIETYSPENIYTNLVQPAYEGVSTNYRNELKGLVKNNPNSIAVKELLLLQMRIAHSIRNNGYAKAARDKFVMNLGALKVNWKDSKKRKHERMQDLWDEFAQAPSLDGYGTLANIQSTWHSSLFQSGNAYTRLHIRTGGARNTIPLKLEVIQSELHDITYTGDRVSNAANIACGIEFSDTRPINYFFRKGLYESHWFGVANSNEIITIPASELIHMFVRDLPGQWLGIPSLASVLLPLYEIDELVDATVAKQKAAQAIAWIITNTNPMALTPVGSPISSKDKDKKDRITFKANGGNVQYLNKGENIQFYQSTDIGENLQTLITNEVRKIACAVGIPYHQLTGDTSGLDFSSIRALAIELRTRLEYIHHFYTIPFGLAPLTAYFKNLAILHSKKVGNAIPTYQLPRFYGVDELKDTQADLLEVQNNMSTLQSKLDERHVTFEEILEDKERQLELRKFDLTSTSVNTNQSNNIEANINSVSA